MARQRRTYTPAFKAEAVKLVTQQGYSVAAAARRLLRLAATPPRRWARVARSTGWCPCGGIEGARCQPRGRFAGAIDTSQGSNNVGPAR